LSEKTKILIFQAKTNIMNVQQIGDKKASPLNSRARIA